MLRLGNVEWNAILLNNFAGQELCTMLHICKLIKRVVTQDRKLMTLIALRHQTTLDRFLMESTSQRRLYPANLLLRDAYSKIVASANRVNRLLPTGFGVFEDSTHVVVKCDAQFLDFAELSFFNVAIELEKQLGRYCCTVQHFQIPKDDDSKVWIDRGNWNYREHSTICFRGHVILLRINKNCFQPQVMRNICKTKFQHLSALAYCVDHTTFESFAIDLLKQNSL
jgi:hypothetical protein